MKVKVDMMRATHDYLDDDEVKLVFEVVEPWESFDSAVVDDEELNQVIDGDDDWVEEIDDSLDDFPSEDGLDLYFRQMSQQPLLSAQQEISLAQAIEQGKFAEEHFITPYKSVLEQWSANFAL